jgi:predicted nucleic acid-binding Zn ribbon protein
MSDDPEANCPRCGTPGRRLFFPTGIVFKGSGFYKTDSRRAASASVNGGGPAGGGKAATEGSSSSEKAKTSTAGTTPGSTEAPASGGAPPSGTSKGT